MRSRFSSPFGLIALAALTLPFAAEADVSESPLDSAQATAGASAGARLEALRSSDLVAQLRAIRAAPFWAVPEEALPELATIAKGRDSALAPAAAVSAYRISQRLSRLDLEAREADLEALGEAKTAFAAIASDSSARGDVRRLSGYVASSLGAL